MKRLRKFFALSGKEKRLFCESLSLHLVVGLVLKVLPFRMIPQLFADRPSAGNGDGVPHKAHNGDSSGIPLLVKGATARAGYLSPWRNRCLVSSLTARLMLRRRRVSSDLSLGVAKDHGGKLLAHAWLKSGDLEIIEKSGNYTELFLF